MRDLFAVGIILFLTFSLLAKPILERISVVEYRILCLKPREYMNACLIALCKQNDIQNIFVCLLKQSILSYEDLLLSETYLRDHSSILCWWIICDVFCTRKYVLIKVEKAINLLLIRLTIDPDTLSMQNLALPNVSVCVSPTDDAVSRIRVQLFALFLFPLNLLFDDSWSHYDSSSETQFTGVR